MQRKFFCSPQSPAAAPSMADTAHVVRMAVSENYGNYNPYQAKKQARIARGLRPALFERQSRACRLPNADNKPRLF
jgi:hypothetical protein